MFSNGWSIAPLPTAVCLDEGGLHNLKFFLYGKQFVVASAAPALGGRETSGEAITSLGDPESIPSDDPLNLLSGDVLQREQVRLGCSNLIKVAAALNGLKCPLEGGRVLRGSSAHDVR